jgi:hypothetical protein
LYERGWRHGQKESEEDEEDREAQDKENCEAEEALSRFIISIFTQRDSDWSSFELGTTHSQISAFAVH